MANPLISDLKEEIEIVEKKMKDLEATIGKQDHRVNYLQTSAFTLANYYFVFQGIILTAVVRIGCPDRWFLFSLSLVAATLNLVSLVSIARSYIKSIRHRMQTWSELHNFQLKLDKLKIKLDDCRVAAQAEPCSEAEVSEFVQALRQSNDVEHVDAHEKRVQKFYFGTCMFLFLGFTAIVIVGCWRIPCGKGATLNTQKQN